MPPTNLDAPQPGSLTTIIEPGLKVTASDYPMEWKSHEKEDSPSTTHEIAFDTENDFDRDFLYVSGMAVDRIARVSKKDPTRQQIFIFPKKNENGRKHEDAQPHTLRFANVKEDYGMLWVGLENQGLIVKLNMVKLLTNNKMHATEGDIPLPFVLEETDFSTVCDVRISGDNIPVPINTRPHGFCFDKDYTYIYFTGKLTNTVGRIKMHGTDENKELQHFALPTLGAVPIYVTLGPDNNVWGTCLGNSIVFRVTTDANNPVVHEMHISPYAAKRRPIAIIPDPRGFPFMWFSTEAGHSVCRLDTNAFEKEHASKQKKGGASNNCVCSSGCQFLFRATASPSWHHKIITEFPIPKVNHKMKLGGLAIDKDGAIWTQSYVDAEDNPEELPDYVLKLGVNVHDPTSTHGPKRKSVVNITGLPIEYYELPTKNTILHRIAIAPDNGVWFTELGADRIGTIAFEDTRKKREASGNGEQQNKKRCHSSVDREDDQEPPPGADRLTNFNTTRANNSNSNNS